MSTACASGAAVADGDLLADSAARGRRGAHAVLAASSKSFRLAGRLLSRRVRDDAAVCYAFCRRADDLIDDALDPRANVRRLRQELDQVYAPGAVRRDNHGNGNGDGDDEVLLAFREMVARRKIPRAYPQALLDGFAMDADRVRYASWAELDLYCYRVAGVVGLMMTHVLGVHDPRCLPAGVALGMAMQLTNISRDVAEDWRRGRLYIPACLLHGNDPVEVEGSAPPEPLRAQLPAAVRALLARADEGYRAARLGFVDLPWRSAFAIRVAALVYADIGRELERRGFDPMLGRAVVTSTRKLALVAWAAACAIGEAPRRLGRWWWRRRTPEQLARQSPPSALGYPP